MNALRYFCLCVLLFPILSSAEWKGRVDDVVSAKVVSVVVDEGDVKAGSECIVLRDGKEVGRLRVRSTSGVCRVLSGEVCEGDVVVSAEDRPEVSSVDKTPVDPDHPQAHLMTNKAPQTVQALLEAEGTFELAARLAPEMPGATLRPLLESAAAQRARIYPAITALLSGTPQARVAAALRDAGHGDTADRIAPDKVAAAGYHLAPLYPEEYAEGPPYNPYGYGRVALLDGEASLWGMPGRWGREPGPADFSGWIFDGETLTVTNPVGALIRTDFEIGDGEVSGEVKVGGGAGVYLILRSDVVVRLLPGKPSPRTGNVGVRYGHHNLRQLGIWGTAPEFAPDEWVPFSARLERGKLTVRVANSNVVESTVTETDAGTVLSDRGHYGFGSFDRSGGGFRKMTLTALTIGGQRALPRFMASTGYDESGPGIRMLSEASRFKSLVHNRVESRKFQHRVEDGVLSLRGAPYAQFTLADTEYEHYVARGRIRWAGEGSVWFRAHSKLMLGLRLSEEGASPYLIKHSTGNFHFTNQRFSGPAFEKDKWYDWEFTWHGPQAVLSVNSQTVRGAWTGELKSAGPVQFGVSSYNCPAELSDVVIQALKVRHYTVGEERLSVLIEEGRKQLAAAIKLVEKENDEASRSALRILNAEKGHALVTPEEVNTVAQSFRASGDWTTYLDILEADIDRYDSEEEKETRRSVWARAKEKYELALEMTGAGEIGLDRILRLTEDQTEVSVHPVAVGATGSTVRVFIPGAKGILELNAADASISELMPLDFKPERMIDRGSHLLCVVSGESNEVLKVAWPGGAVLKRYSLADGRVMDMVAGQAGVSYISVDENNKESVYDFESCVVYRLDEADGTVTRTDAIGQQLALDPYGRYLYSGFSHEIGSDRMPDPSFLRVMPMGRQLDHLIRYTIGESLEFSGERPRPGFGGIGVVPSPDGRTVTYVARNGSVPLMAFPGQGERAAPGVPAFSAARLSRVVGTFPLSRAVQGMAHNPVSHEVYILTETGLQGFAPDSYEPSRKLVIPESFRKGDVRQMLVTGDGRQLLIATGGEGAGVYMTSLSETDGTPLPDRREALFTVAAEQKSQAWFSKPDAPYLAVSDCETLVAPGPKRDAEKLKSLDALTMPDLPAMSSSGQKDADVADDLDDLESFSAMAERYPFSWLKRAHDAQASTNVSHALQLRIAQHLRGMDRSAAACRILSDVITESEDTGMVAKAYQILAGIYQQGGDVARALSATRKAVRQNPGNAFTYVQLARLLDKAGMPIAAANQRMMAVHLFPSLAEEWEALRESGIDVPAPRASLTRVALFDACSPAVVLVRHGRGVGTGFIIGRSGILLTNHHVIDGHSDDITVSINVSGDGSKAGKHPAIVLATDARRDIALLQIEGIPEGVTPLRLVSSGGVRTGDTITAIGNPGMGTQVLSQTATEGIVSNAERRLGALRFIQISAAVNPGNSGGPLLNQRGEVVGMVTLKAQLENVGFAVPSDDLLGFVEKHFR